MEQRVLCGDIGGTKTRLAIATVIGDRVHIDREATYASVDYQKFDLLLTEFLSSGETPVQAAFGVAGPVTGRAVKVTNLPWIIDADVLMRRFGFECCSLLNDLEATAWGLSALSADDLLVLQAGDAEGNVAVIAAGTGLGEAGLFWDGARHLPYATEGGHASFAPTNTLEFALLRHLQQQFGHVSWERVVSGMGIVSIYEFLCQYRHIEAQQYGAAAISLAALEGSDEICSQTMQLFVRLYGAEAGNLALKVMSRGGLYIGGGIAPKILPMLQDGDFLEALLNKGRMRPLLESMPVKVILNDRAALYGPALRAGEGRSARDTMRA